MRIKMDKYYSPVSIYHWLQEQLELTDKVIFDPCCGALHPTEDAFNNGNDIYQNDLDPDIASDYNWDAATAKNWEELGHIDWTITNPPYQSRICELIVNNALENSIEGVAMLLRLSWLEPCVNRRRFLQGNFGGKVLLACWTVNPRVRFDPSKTGTDNSTVAWFIWANPKQIGLKPFNFCTDWNR